MERHRRHNFQETVNFEKILTHYELSAGEWFWIEETRVYATIATRRETARGYRVASSADYVCKVTWTLHLNHGRE